MSQIGLFQLEALLLSMTLLFWTPPPKKRDHSANVHYDTYLLWDKKETEESENRVLTIHQTRIKEECQRNVECNVILDESRAVRTTFLPVTYVTPNALPNGIIFPCIFRCIRRHVLTRCPIKGKRTSSEHHQMTWDSLFPCSDFRGRKTRKSYPQETLLFSLLSTRLFLESRECMIHLVDIYSYETPCTWGQRLNFDLCVLILPKRSIDLFFLHFLLENHAQKAFEKDLHEKRNAYEGTLVRSDGHC
jgi:hypothetical protein